MLRTAPPTRSAQSSRSRADSALKACSAQKVLPDVTARHWTDGWRWLVACALIGGLPLLNGQARALALGVLVALWLLTLVEVKRSADTRRGRA